MEIFQGISLLFSLFFFFFFWDAWFCYHSWIGYDFSASQFVVEEHGYTSHGQTANYSNFYCAVHYVWFKRDSIEWNVSKTIADSLNYLKFTHGCFQLTWQVFIIRDWVVLVSLRILIRVFLMGSFTGYIEPFNTNGLYSFLILSLFSFMSFLYEKINPCGQLGNAFLDSTAFFAR